MMLKEGKLLAESYWKPFHREFEHRMFSVDKSLTGTIFSYDTSATHVLSALVERLMGEPLLDYLRHCFLDEIEFSKDAKWLNDPMNVTQGGSELICTMRDVAKVAYVCSNYDMYKEKQLLPAAFLKEASKRQIDTSMLGTLDERQDDGYQIWQTRYGGFCFYGLGGQLADHYM